MKVTTRMSSVKVSLKCPRDKPRRILVDPLVQFLGLGSWVFLSTLLVSPYSNVGSAHQGKDSNKVCSHLIFTVYVVLFYLVVCVSLFILFNFILLLLLLFFFFISFRAVIDRDGIPCNGEFSRFHLECFLSLSTGNLTYKPIVKLMTLVFNISNSRQRLLSKIIIIINITIINIFSFHN